MKSKMLLAIALTALPLMGLGCGSSTATTEETQEEPEDTSGDEDMSAEDAGVAEEGDGEESSEAP